MTLIWTVNREGLHFEFHLAVSGAAWFPKLGGSWLVSGVISRVTVIITHIGGHISPLIHTHEPPRRK